MSYSKVFIALSLVTCLLSNPQPGSALSQNFSEALHRLEQKLVRLETLASSAFMSPTVPSTNCTLASFDFRRTGQAEDYVRYRGYFPRLTSATVCAWVRVDAFSSSEATILSYATSSHDNRLLVTIRPPDELVVLLTDSYARFQLTVPHRMNHICIWIESGRRMVGIAINGIGVGELGYAGYPIEGGGSMILGQDQDRADAGGLDGNQAFSGTIANLMIWPRVLTPVEVLRMGGMCQCPVDHAVVMTNDRIEMWGQSSYKIPTQCYVLTV